MSQWIELQQAANIADVETTTISRWRVLGHIESRKVFGGHQINRKSLNIFLNRRPPRGFMTVTAAARYKKIDPSTMNKVVRRTTCPIEIKKVRSITYLKISDVKKFVYESQSGKSNGGKATAAKMKNKKPAVANPGKETGEAIARQLPAHTEVMARVNEVRSKQGLEKWAV